MNSHSLYTDPLAPSPIYMLTVSPAIVFTLSRFLSPFQNYDFALHALYMFVVHMVARRWFDCSLLQAWARLLCKKERERD